MPLYRFNLVTTDGLIEDEEGRDLPDLERARIEALNGARSLIAEDVLQGRLDLDGRIEVIDADGTLLLTIRFDEAAGAVGPILSA